MPADDGIHRHAQVIRFFLYTILYWTLPRDRVTEPEEEEDEPLASDAPKSDAKRKSDDGKSGDIELGRRCAGSMPTYWRHSLALLMSRAHQHCEAKRLLT